MVSPSIEDKDDIGGILGDRSEIFLAFPDRIFRPLAVVDFPGHREYCDRLVVLVAQKGKADLQPDREPSFLYSSNSMARTLSGSAVPLASNFISSSKAAKVIFSDSGVMIWSRVCSMASSTVNPRMRMMDGLI